MHVPRFAVIAWFLAVSVAVLSAAAEPPVRDRSANPQAVGSANDTKTPPIAAQPATHAAETEPDEIEIKVKRIPPTRVVYEEHTGPYWTIGPVFQRVQQYMSDHDLQGSLFVRYPDDVSAVPGNRLRMEVGCILEAVHSPVYPFKTAKYNAALAVTMVTMASGTSPIQYYPIMRHWAEARGYRVLGPITEIYGQPGRGGAGEQSVEIQMTIQAGSKPNGTDRKSPVGKRPSPPTDREATISVAPISIPRGAAAPPAQAENDGASPIRQLLANRDFDGIAKRTVPDARVMPQSLPLWLGQVVHRIGAVARGIAQVYPRDGGTVSALSEAIGRRYKAASVNLAADPLADPVVRVDAKGDPLAADKQAIVRDLDAILGAISVRSLDADSAAERLAEIIQRVCDLVDRSVANP